MNRDAVLIFHSIHRVMKAEKALKEVGLDIRLMPVPRELSSDCGLAVSFRSRDKQEVEVALAAAECPWEELHVWRGERYERDG